uniref:GTP-binding protein 6 n=1 Tax=Ascaris suum TaxID=6253 RepID=F1KZZ6_ASCSU
MDNAGSTFMSTGRGSMLSRRFLVRSRFLGKFCSLNATAREEASRSEDDYRILADAVGVRNASLEGHSVLVVHPRIRWGRHSAPASTTAELQLQEAVALTNTLPNFRVCSSVVVGTDYNTKKRRIWAQGRLDTLAELKEKERATAIMINVDVLSPLQQAELFSFFRVPIFDRYNIVLLIFKKFAKTKEARLQVELAEIPYIRHRLKCIDVEHIDPSILHVTFPISTKGDKWEVLRLREHTLRKRIKAAVDEKLNAVNGERIQRGIAATVALVGYTNTGKSSLIRRLTQDESIFVEDRLFATLDSSAHFCRLPSGTPILLTDTIGFISDLPMQLFASFHATLSHVVNADLLLVVEDVSHPNVMAQREVVIETLDALSVKRSLVDSLIYVGNKCDKIDPQLCHQPDVCYISCLNGSGIKQLIAEIDKRVMALRGSVVRHLKLHSGSPALPYLYRESLLISQPIPVDGDDFLLCKVVMDDAQFAKFRARFAFTKMKSDIS